jgi:hypothetical protein
MRIFLNSVYSGRCGLFGRQSVNSVREMRAGQ